MQSYRFLVLCLALVLCLHLVVAVPHHALRRQDVSASDQSQALTSTAIRSSWPSTTTAPLGSSSSPVFDHASLEASTRPSSIASDVSRAPAVVTSASPAATSSVDNPADSLPIHPKVTPAMGLTGALLLITGLVYAVIGIKNKWIYIFGSAAYCTALAVTVLIVYLMNPPVSDGIQGAFFVAAFFTGIIFGVLSLVFSDITEGFGCLLGGFCLSMWFLSLKSGGLISSSTGRAIFIGCMSAGGYSLSFSHYTRNYGLIASISFSGASATMLGIDCLARAGWKEFWLFLWSLNDDIFPLNTTTYPLTKNIKAELAGVIIIAIFGVVSQLRVWNLVKERREKSAAQEIEKREENNREEEAQGRIVEDKFQKERAQWEAAYGNKSHPDSSVKSSSVISPKGSTSVQETEVHAADSVEMVNLKSGVPSVGAVVTVNVLREDDIQNLDAQGNPTTYRSLPSGSNFIGTEDMSSPAAHPPVTKRVSARSVVPPPPAVVPLPFNIPTESDSSGEDDDSLSVSAVPESHYEATINQRPISKRVSDMSANRRRSLHRASHVLSESSEALVNEEDAADDHASSLAATLDDDDGDNVSVRKASPPQPSTDTEFNTLAGESAREEDADLADVNDVAIREPAHGQSSTITADARSYVGRETHSARNDYQLRADTLLAGNKSGDEQNTLSTTTDSQTPVGQAESQIGSLKDAPISARLSRVASSYRTNEWAKHLEGAEKPDLEDLAVAVSPHVILEEVPEEKVVPVSDEIAAPLMSSKRNSKRVSVERKTNGLGLDRSASTFSQRSKIGAASVNASLGVLSRSSSGAQLDALAPLPSNTLLGQRETLMRKRTSNQSIAPGSSATNLLELADQESMSLAQRRQILQKHQSPALMLQHQASSASPRRSPPSTSQKWQNQSWTAKGAPAGFDSHQPKRTSSSQSDKKREELYAGWRDHMRDVTPPQTQAYLIEQQRAALLNERRQKELEKQQRESMQQQRASMLDSMMRSGHMMDAHREAMRKMQANANRNAS